MGDDWIGWAVFFGFIGFVAWLVIRGRAARRRFKLLPPAEQMQILEEQRRVLRFFDDPQPKQIGPSANIDGTPIAPGTTVDIHGRPFGVTSR